MSLNKRTFTSFVVVVGGCVFGASFTTQNLEKGKLFYMRMLSFTCVE